MECSQLSCLDAREALNGAKKNAKSRLLKVDARDHNQRNGSKNKGKVLTVLWLRKTEVEIFLREVVNVWNRKVSADVSVGDVFRFRSSDCGEMRAKKRRRRKKKANCEG